MSRENIQRPIKFRVWHVALKKMVDLKAITPLALNMDTGGLLIPFSDGLILMQSTGLTDKNGKDIFESHLVQFYENGRLHVCEVLYRRGCFVVESFDSHYDPDHNGYELLCDICDDWEVHVVGTAYQNP